MVTRRGFIDGVSAAGAAALFGVPPSALAATAEDGAGTDTEVKARDAIREVNAGMRASYAALKSEMIRRLSPVIVVQNDATGGKFTLVRDGNPQQSVRPVPELFELAKSISHVPQGIFSILAAYLSDRVPHLPNACRIDPHDLDMVAFAGPRSDGWSGPLQSYAATLTTARSQLGKANLPRQLEFSCGQILDEALQIIRDCVSSGTFDMASLQEFSSKTYPSIRTNMTYAAAAQISGVEGLMRSWRDLVGEKAWENLYTVVLSIWTTSELNQASIIIRRCMNPAKVATHLIDLSTAEVPRDPVFVALDNLARIVQDNVSAETVFPTDPAIADAFKGKADLLSVEILDQLGAPTGASTLAPLAASACPLGKQKPHPAV
ncbi:MULTISPECIES: twin-arginine translocation signal domain-containing protein [Streptomyces]|uniref:twin-arginine translocation signal domain-containing protein n=1 Tax=Streptomyces TaxID=1883 RepID=UPI001E37FFE0|nr:MULTISPECIES: twin-arginine translocation signal domain-containing protein [Streptomyces]UFQ19869.1 twin-arginine translocation signal domain-containing protein [Streptomyces huasconensis]WCL89493.1 twin-arginine translocation signal domain-containing protein [Streptomyces sp. JCM 35825]